MAIDTWIVVTFDSERQRYEDETHSPSDDTTSTPHEGDATIVEIPVEHLGCFTEQHEALCVRHNLGSVQSL